MITMKQHDTAPDLSITLTDNGAVVDLTPATSIRIIAVRRGAPVFSRVVTGSSLGVVTMVWQPLDTSLPGELAIEVEVDWPGSPSKTQTFPPNGVLRVNIEPDLG
jgi:hypothetical protein